MFVSHIILNVGLEYSVRHNYSFFSPPVVTDFKNDSQSTAQPQESNIGEVPLWSVALVWNVDQIVLTGNHET